VILKKEKEMWVPKGCASEQQRELIFNYGYHAVKFVNKNSLQKRQKFQFVSIFEQISKHDLSKFSMRRGRPGRRFSEIFQKNFKIPFSRNRGFKSLKEKRNFAEKT